jgi:hypothetical protein
MSVFLAIEALNDAFREFGNRLVPGEAGGLGRDERASSIGGSRSSIHTKV